MKGRMRMQQNDHSLTAFVPGNHLILGAAGSGKTRLIWTLLQSPEFCKPDTVNIVLTDSEKRIWLNPSDNPIIVVNPYAPDISWATEPTTPGIYYAACEYLPRITTFLECLANFARYVEHDIKHPLRVFIDFPKKYWRDFNFFDQINRLIFISESLAEDGQYPLEIWSVLTTPKDLNPKQYVAFKNSHLILMPPITDALVADVKEALGVELSLENSREMSDGSFCYFSQNADQAVMINACK